MAASPLAPGRPGGLVVILAPACLSIFFWRSEELYIIGWSTPPPLLSAGFLLDQKTGAKKSRPVRSSAEGPIRSAEILQTQPLYGPRCRVQASRFEVSNRENFPTVPLRQPASETSDGTLRSSAPLNADLRKGQRLREEEKLYVGLYVCRYLVREPCRDRSTSATAMPCSSSPALRGSSSRAT